MHPSWTECVECHGARRQDHDFRPLPPRTPTEIIPDDDVVPASPRGSTVPLSQPQQPVVPPVSPYVSPQTVPLAAPGASPAEPAQAARPGRLDAISPAAPLTPDPQVNDAAPGKPFAPVASPGTFGAKGITAGESKAGGRIVGMLLTYSWVPEGQIFPVREGRNRIGRSHECEIQLPGDAHLSGLNTYITYRKDFKIGDFGSMGGTDLNGEPVEDTNEFLPNYALIRAGATHFVFIASDPALTAS